MFYVIQKDVFNSIDFDNIIYTLERLQLEYEIIEAPNYEYIQFNTTRTDVFAFGALKMARLAPQYNWNPGMLMTPNHDYEVYKHHYKENLLNYDSQIYPLSQDFQWNANEYFIRPTKDTKIFNAKVFKQDQWIRFKTDLLKDGYTGSLTPQSLIQVATTKTICKEIRFFIVNGQIITGSQYRLGQHNVIHNPIIDQDAYFFCNKMIQIFQLATAFVMDICLTSNQTWKIVECGCINCAGLYMSDTQKLIAYIDEFFRGENNHVYNKKHYFQ